MGRKRSIVTDTLGLLLAVLVTAAGVQDSVAGTQLIDRVATTHASIRKVWVDGGYPRHFVEHAATLGIDLEITARAPGTRAFIPIPKPWTVERNYGWLILHRHPARDSEAHPHRSEAMIHLATPTSWPAASPVRTPSLGATRHHRIKSTYRDEKRGKTTSKARRCLSEDSSVASLPEGARDQSRRVAPRRGRVWPPQWRVRPRLMRPKP